MVKHCSQCAYLLGSRYSVCETLEKNNKCVCGQELFMFKVTVKLIFVSSFRLYKIKYLTFSVIGCCLS